MIALKKLVFALYPVSVIPACLGFVASYTNVFSSIGGGMNVHTIIVFHMFTSLCKLAKYKRQTRR